MAAGSADRFTFPFGLTQATVGDSQGLSVVHVNRVMRDLKAHKLIKLELQSKTMTILDWDQLRVIGDFDKGYLHILK